MASKPTQCARDDSLVFTLPDLFTLSSMFPFGDNPNYTPSMEARSWLTEDQVANPQVLAALSDPGGIALGRLAALVIPNASASGLDAACELFYLITLVDDTSDKQTGSGAERTVQSFLNVLRNQHSDDGTSLSLITMAFCARLGPWVHTHAFCRFRQRCESWLQHTAEEAALRESGTVLSLDAYTKLRRESSGIQPGLAIMEFSLDMELPDTVYEDEDFNALYFATVDMVAWSNDIYSYRRERANGVAMCNILTVLMENKGMSLQAASDWIGEQFQALRDRFLSARGALRDRTFGSESIDANVERLITEMGHWVIGNIVWCFETKRYFGAQRFEVMATRRVSIGEIPPTRYRHCGHCGHCGHRHRMTKPHQMVRALYEHCMSIAMDDQNGTVWPCPGMNE